jgi:hypothetical protein
VAVDKAHLRAWRAHKQGLTPEGIQGNLNNVLERSGWSRSIGGVNPYLALFTRSAASAQATDQAVQNKEILELPAARGCTYVLPKSDFQIGLAVGKSFREAETKTALKLGVPEKEIDQLCEAVLKALESGDKDPAQLKTEVGPACRNLGEEGKKKGLTTTLPVALGKLQAEGQILRRALNGRLDSQRYAYTIWHNGPKQTNLEDAQTEVAKRFLSWIGPATAAQFGIFMGMSTKAAKQILDRLSITEIEDHLILKEDLDPYKSFKQPQEPSYHLIGCIDSLTHLPRDIAANLDDQDFNQHQAGEKGLTKLGEAQELTNNAIVDRGRIVGLWEYDPDRAEIAWYSFTPPTQELKQAIAKTEEFIRDQLGDARTFSLDSPQSRKPKIEALRGMALQTV